MPRRRSNTPILLPLALALVLAVVVPPASGCSCVKSTFKESFDRAKLVVRARVLSIRVLPRPTPLPCLTGTPPCLPPVILYQPVKYTLLLQRVFKGCRPSRRVFYGMTFANSAACGQRLRRRASYMLNLGTPQPCPLDKIQNRLFYSINSCQGNLVWKSLTRKEKRFLKKASKDESNQCSK